MNRVDIVSTLWTAAGALRGWKRGLSDEAYRLVRLGVAFGAGCGLYGAVSRLLGRIFSTEHGATSAVGFVGTMAGAWWILHAVRKGFTAWIASRWPKQQAVGGAIAGGLRALVAAMGAVAAWLLATDASGVAENTVMGRIVSVFIHSP